MPTAFYHLEYREVVTLEQLCREWHEDICHGYVAPCTFAQYMEMFKSCLVKIPTWQGERAFAILSLLFGSVRRFGILFQKLLYNFTFFSLG